MLDKVVREAYEHSLSVFGGHPAVYIPELSQADPDRLGIAVCSTQGEIFTAGDSADFTIQSICKPLQYALALDSVGMRRVLERVGVEPTGDRFDCIMRLDSGRHRPHNPMINAGAIAVSSLLAEQGVSLDALVHFTGRPLRIDSSVLESEKATAHTNRSLLHFLTHLGVVADPEPAFELYLQACSILVNCRDLAVIAATLANNGINPITGVRAVSAEHVSAVLTVMATCGMYDGSGTFMMDLGLPAKSGVSGGILAVAPGRAGFAAFAPPLDASGNSVRGQAAILHLARALHCDIFTPAPPKVVADRLPIVLDEVVERQRHGRGGELVWYAPEVRSPYPDQYAVAVCTVAGEELVRGDVQAIFTLQAAANPFAYALALERCGVQAVHARVGCEPSGNQYDEFTLHANSGRPHNALSNAGAIAVADILDDDSRLGEFAGEALTIDAAVLAAEFRVGHRNLAIAHRLCGAGIITDVHRAVERYLAHCSLQVTCRQLARMGAVLAAGGVDPVTGQRVIHSDVARRVVAMMYSCGMHNDSGVYAFEVGVPSKSGITGGIVAVIPNVMSIATYSPRVSGTGASVLGWATMRDLAGSLQLGLLDIGE